MEVSVKQEVFDGELHKRSTATIIDISDSDSSGSNSDCDSDSDMERLRKKPKIEEVILPIGFLDPLTPEERLLLQKQLNQEPSVPVTPVMQEDSSSAPMLQSCKQFWKAGDYENSDSDGIDSTSAHTAGMDHLRVHPRFLHSNATSHKWALGAFAELLDNALDEVCNGATYVHVDVLDYKKDPTNKMLLFEDNGGGMTPDIMRNCMSLGYSQKSKLANTIGQYGNGFKTSTMRLGADVIVFTRCCGKEGRNPTQSIGMLSFTFLRKTGKEDIVVPMIDYEKDGDDWRMMVRSSPADWRTNMETLMQWSPYSSKEDLLQQFNYIEDQGTRIIIYNLWEDDEGQMELDFDSDLHDIQMRGVNRDEKKIEMAKKYPNSRHFLTYRHSLRSYAAILYLRIPPRFRIILRGKDIDHHNIINDMMHTEHVQYKPAQQLDDGTRHNQNVSAMVTLGFVKDAEHHIDIQGFNVYHKNRLIKPFWRVWNAAGSDGRGVIGVLEANFVEPAHDKQGFERTTVLSRLEARLVVFQKKYWSTNCHLIGYAKRQHVKNSVSPERDSRPPIKDKSCVLSVPNGMSTSDGKLKLKITRTLEGNSCAEGKTVDNTSSKIPRRPHKSFPTHDGKKQVAGSTYPQAVAADANDSINTDSNKDMIAKLMKENRELKLRLGREDGMILSDLLTELQYERDRNTSLEIKAQKAQEKIEEMNKEQLNLINLLSDEKELRDQNEAILRNKWKEASDTVEELRKKVMVLESKLVASCKIEYTC